MRDHIDELAEQMWRRQHTDAGLTPSRAWSELPGPVRATRRAAVRALLVHVPMRGSDVELWLYAQQAEAAKQGNVERSRAIEHLLLDYQVRADVGMQLDEPLTEEADQEEDE